ncbi:MAG: hypothetical protein A3K46_05040 [Chloroflexi bacterium RBG_13_60_9]|nr:MAG: hypothetical protein A3K46_05040 [Chloroflexi bacterium RBG_13_60_9]
MEEATTIKKESAVVSCPHYYFHVLPSKQKIRPSCGKDVNDLSGIDPDRTIMNIPDNISLPDCCFSCGHPAKRKGEVREKRDLDKAPTLLNFISHAAATASVPIYMTAEYGDLEGIPPTILCKTP